MGKGGMWLPYATVAAYAVTTFASPALSDFSPFKLILYEKHIIHQT